MAYWTLDGLYGVLPKSRVIQLVDDEAAGDVVESPPNAAYNRVARAGAKADAVIDTYLRGHYEVPLATVPDVIADIACTLAAVEVYMLSDVDEIPEKLRDARRQAIGILEQVRDDKLRLLDSDSAEQTIQVSKTSADQMWTDGVLNQF